MRRTTSQRAQGPLVTVLIPTFNRCEWLADAIASVLAQTHPEFAVIVSDNASTDATADVVAQFDDPRLSYVRRERNMGLNEHYNLCIDEVSTKYFLILPDDDTLLPDAIETLLPVLELNARAGIAHGRARLVRGDVVVSPSHDMTGLAGDAVESGSTFIRKAMSASHRIHATTVLYRTAAIQPVPLDLRDYPATEFGVWLRVALDWDVAFVARTIAVYRMHDSSYTSANAKVTRGGYIQRPHAIQNVFDVKMRFLADHRERIASSDALRHAAKWARASQLVNYAGHATLPERRIVPTITTLRECIALEPRVLLDAGAWRLFVGSLLGRRLVERMRRRWPRSTTYEVVTP